MKALLFHERGKIVNKLFRKEKEEHLKKRILRSFR
jgi:23S rRNA U2552 (ribose-2'-O)-methylase RlmE/FtsJ